MTAAEIRQSFFDFFREKGHTIVPSASLLPDSPNLLFTNAGMNQFVPIFLGQQKPAWNPPRVADTQKCIRAGGKHNDLDDVGLDTYHHTFFEMLGNWSFGDYFKKEAIEWAWELVVDRWQLPASRLYATVYCPASRRKRWDDELRRIVHGAFIGAGVMEWSDKNPEDQNAIEIPDRESAQRWAHVFRRAGLSEAEVFEHIVAGDRKDNFWMMGDTGPCGPCSELHVDLTPAGDTQGSLVNAGDARCIEIWNLVFIQFNANPDGSFSPLPQRHVDTGMGLERITAMIQGTKNFADFSGVVSNYETDVFRPIFDELEKLSDKKYESTLPSAGSTGETQQEKIDIAFRVIADHIRTLSFAIADGILPSNEGRGYVLRRILRRAVRYGRTLGFHQPFFYNLTDVLVRTMSNVFSELRSNESTIKKTILREEESFNRTLDSGIDLFEDIAVPHAVIKALKDEGFEEATEGDEGYQVRNRATQEVVYSNKRRFFYRSKWRDILKTIPVIPAAAAFKLYDTYGFPLDLTELIARERGFTVDVAGFEELMQQQRERARVAQKKSIVEILHDQYDSPTAFVGYDAFEAEVHLLGTISNSAGRQFAILDKSPFYAEMGGQVGDRGEIRLSDRKLKVLNTTKRGHTYYHEIEGQWPIAWTTGIAERAHARVDAYRRKLIQGHHTVTHLLHWALHQNVSRDATQKGSYVGPEKLTFDFSSAALTSEQKRQVEKLVNEKVAENAPVSWTEIPYAEAKKRSDIQQFFGDKYGETVRVVQIGGEEGKLNGYSMELCGGTHVRVTGDIGSFRIVREEAIAAGIRRIEAVAGDAAREWAKQEAERQREKFEALARKKSDVAALPAFADDDTTAAMLEQIDARAAHLEKIETEVHEWQKQQAKASEADLKNRAAATAKELREAHGEAKAIVATVADGDAKLLQSVVDTLKSHFKGPIFLAGASDGRVALIASIPKELTSQFQANKLIQEIAPIVGGKGGGRPDNAQGAGRDVSKIDEALTRAREILL